MEKDSIQTAIEQHRAGKISIGKAAQKAGVTISEMMDKLAEFGIENKMTKEQYQQGIKKQRTDSLAIYTCPVFDRTIIFNILLNTIKNIKKIW
ncbi:MAG: UPF0175 family protein [archaeon]